MSIAQARLAAEQTLTADMIACRRLAYAEPGKFEVHSPQCLHLAIPPWPDHPGTFHRIAVVASSAGVWKAARP